MTRGSERTAQAEANRLRAELRLLADATFARQDQAYGAFPFSDLEYSLVDQAQAAVEAAVASGDRAAVDASLAVFVRRTTPLDVLLDAVGPGDVAGWCRVVREGAERGAWGPVFEVKGCKALGGADLVLRASGTPGTGEWSIDDLPALLGAAGNSLRRPLPDGLQEAVAALRRAFGPDVAVERFVAEKAA